MQNAPGSQRVNWYQQFFFCFWKISFFSKNNGVTAKVHGTFKIDLENQICGYFHYHIRNQCFKIHKYREFDEDRKVHLFGTAPFMGFGSFFFKSHFSRKIMVLGQKCMEH